MRSSSMSSSKFCYPLYIRRNNYEYDDDDDNNNNNNNNNNNSTDFVVLIDNNDDSLRNFNEIVCNIKRDLGLTIRFNNNSTSDPAGHFRPVLLFMIYNYMLGNTNFINSITCTNTHTNTNIYTNTSTTNNNTDI